MGWDGTVPYVFPIFVENRSEFLDYLYTKKVVGQIHYKPNLHQIAHLTDREYSLPMTERFNNTVVSIPVVPTVTYDETNYIADCVVEFFKRGGKL